MLDIIPLSAFSDNYIWLLHDGREALVVDPGEAAPVLHYLAAQNLRLAGIFLTHHHADHIGGVAEILTQHPAPVWGAAHPSIASLGAVHAVYGGEHIRCLGQNWQVLAAPGHTLSHVLFYSPNLALQSGPEPALFSGDTLFSLGCGRLFEGSPAQMLASLERIAALPDDCGIYCAHEYTLTNLRFALSLQAERRDLLQYQAHCLSLRAENRPTLPTRLKLEKQLNPFLQTLQADFCKTMALHLSPPPSTAGALSVFTALREQRNHFS